MKNWGLVLLIGLGLWGWGKAKAQVKPGLVPGAVAPAVTLPVGPVLPALATVAQIAQAVEQAAAKGQLVQVEAPYTAEGVVTYNAPSIVQAAEITGLSTQDWLSLYGFGIVPAGEELQMPPEYVLSPGEVWTPYATPWVSMTGVVWPGTQFYPAGTGHFIPDPDPTSVSGVIWVPA